MRLLLYSALLLSWGGAQCAAQVHDEFEKGALDWGYWCPCQIDEKVPVTFHPDPTDDDDGFATITVDERLIGENDCKAVTECKASKNALIASVVPKTVAPDTADLPEALGPSFFAAPSADAKFIGDVTRNPYCEELQSQDGDVECIQRQEIRLRGYRPIAEEPHWYSIRFRMPDEIENQEDSIRWVIAQWKEKPLDKEYTDAHPEDWGPSPFLAVRFDDGVLHITIQDAECRCLLASAPHPTRRLSHWTPYGNGGSIPPLEDGRPALCESTATGAVSGEACSGERDVYYEYGEAPLLVSPLGEWTELRLQVQSGEDATLIVEQDGHRVVTATGRIGYPHVENPQAGNETRLKFKIGHYRDYMPFPHTMDIDWVTVEKAD